METQASQNVQDGFLNTLRRDRINVTIYLIGGVKLTGRIRSFDKFSVVLESGNLEQLIFKHAISTISVPRGAVQYGHQGGGGGGSYQQGNQPGNAPASTASPAATAPAAPTGEGQS